MKVFFSRDALRSFWRVTLTSDSSQAVELAVKRRVMWKNHGEMMENDRNTMENDGFFPHETFMECLVCFVFRWYWGNVS